MAAFDQLVARDLMTREVLTLRADQTIQEAARDLLERQIQGAPVVDLQGSLVGVISVTDLARLAIEGNLNIVSESDYYRTIDSAKDQRIDWDRGGYHVEVLNGMTVREIMTPTIVSVYEDAGLLTILRTLLDLGIHRVIVLRESDEKVVGVITATDILQAIATEIGRGIFNGDRRNARGLE